MEEEKDELRPKGGYSSTRNHADGRIINEKGETVGRWDDNEEGIRKHAFTKGKDPDKAVADWKKRKETNVKETSKKSVTNKAKTATAERKTKVKTYKAPKKLVETVQGYYNNNKGRKDRNYGENWLRVLIAFGAETSSTLKPYTVKEAEASLKKWHGWKPVLEALEKLEGSKKPTKPVKAKTTKSSKQKTTSAKTGKQKSAPSTANFDYMLSLDNKAQTPPDLVEQDEYKELVEEQDKLFKYLKSVQPVFKGKTPPKPVVLEYKIFNRRFKTDTSWFVGIFEHPHVKVNGSDAWYTCVDYRQTIKTRGGEKETWGRASASGRGVPVEVRFARWQRQRATYIGLDGKKWKSVLPFGRYSHYANVHILPIKADTDGKFHLRIYNQYNIYRGAKGEYIEEIVDPGPMDPHRGLKRMVIPTGIANAIEADDWKTVAKLAKERAK